MVAFVPLLTSSPLTKGGINYTQNLQEETIFPTIPRSECSVNCEIFTKVLKNLSEKLGAEFQFTTLGYYVVRISCLDDAFAEIPELKERSVEGRQLQQKDKKGRKSEGEK